ncbi:cold-responsive protein kinase 1-like isoform X1 [Lycium barbarum]|uniref:cold-responsive protein kinase 1-like isoform X1 n=2 Tax=Lycium barbarum TaxID=112863 RepID=UPI00293F4354|nr:cold-responsive protein kinase 1-like isoform X1 [Lycium barbarum]XP_060192883.1 cold-responsive protein kinase 1-like isoform X1 [Lycium barbarum]XP_060192884.1 cold-responsive protein kinase 1-like isoform X1 [Lycium barbarum]XP_060192885.1 cold-responsive protein kinase 1-like isoform X1 [Lycium barbarum]
MDCCFFGARKKGGHLVNHDTRDTGGHSIASTKNFSFSELQLATNNFQQTNKIGRGGFGTVYKGTLKNGKEIAVKTLAAESRQGLREFLNEIETISNVRHPNLVEIVGCCADGNNRILVYEYLENRSLDRALFGSRTSINLEWDKRATICLGTAQGLAYLHEELVPHIVHRDIKASNILLDKDYTPKIGDFGLAKLFPDSITHISTKIAGTTGYLAPEYVLGGQLTMKADVYSFGVLILETVSGRSSSSSIWQSDKMSLLEWAWQLYQDGKMLELVDEELDDFPEKEVVRYMKVALFCTQANANRRPMMSQVIEMLSRDIRLNEKELTPPGFFQDSGESMRSKSKLSECSTSQQSSVPPPITQVTPR